MPNNNQTNRQPYLPAKHAAISPASWQELTGVLGPCTSHICYRSPLVYCITQSQHIVCQCGEDVLMPRTLTRLINIAMDHAYRRPIRRWKTNQHQPLLSNIEPPQIRRDRAQEYKKAQQLTDRVPIQEILREPPQSRIRSRRPFVIDHARLE